MRPTRSRTVLVKLDPAIRLDVARNEDIGVEELPAEEQSFSRSCRWGCRPCLSISYRRSCRPWGSRTPRRPSCTMRVAGHVLAVVDGRLVDLEERRFGRNVLYHHAGKTAFVGLRDVAHGEAVAVGELEVLVDPRPGLLQDLLAQLPRRLWGRRDRRGRPWLRYARVKDVGVEDRGAEWPPHGRRRRRPAWAPRADYAGELRGPRPPGCLGAHPRLLWHRSMRSSRSNAPGSGALSYRGSVPEEGFRRS